ncbi:MAG: penicillin-binding protein 2 [Actinobacteria bacterium]|nr:penicillin-binding protein 2 [Actinomycetota bacterium]
MNRQIRRVALAMLAGFLALFLNLSWIQLVRAEKLANDPRNTRLLLKEYSIERGAILSADGRQILADSKPTPDQALKFLREYPKGPLFSDVTGYYSIRFGRTGLEQLFNKELTGQGGVITMQDLNDRLFTGKEKGDNLVLTLDTRLQQAANDALTASGHKGAVVALDPASGAVLAMITSPSFDPNPLSQHDANLQQTAFEAMVKDANRSGLNRATLATFPPGSTMKLISAAAALENGLGPDTSYPPAKNYQPAQTDKPIGNFGGSTCGGNMAEALKVSCNSYFAHLGADLPQGAFEKTAKAFGFTSVPPFDLKAAASKLPTAAQLRSPAFAAQSAIGQFDVAATPLQMALVVAAMGEGGKVPTPHVVAQIEDARGSVVKKLETKTWNQALSEQTANIIKGMMVAVVDGGTGRAAHIDGVSIAGKTGTAQVGAQGSDTDAWFVCFAPADSPKIALAIVVEGAGDPKNETGGRLAAPIAKKILEASRGVLGW